MANVQYARIFCFYKNNLLLEQSAGNLIENKESKTITITSYIPETGFEIDPEVGFISDISMILGPKIKTFKAELLEKKVSFSVDKAAYQLLTFKILNNIKIVELTSIDKDVIQSMNINLISNHFLNRISNPDDDTVFHETIKQMRKIIQKNK